MYSLLHDLMVTKCFWCFGFSLQEAQNIGKTNWEHLSEELHVLITVEDTEERANIKLQRAAEEIKKLLVPTVSCNVH